MNHLVRQYYEQGTHVVLVDTGNSYQGLCEMIRCKTNGADGVYFTYTEEKPISFNPFYTDDYVFDVEKKDSIKTLLLTLWKSEDDKVTKTESGELGSAVNAYIERIRADRSIVPSFNTFYEYMRDDYRRELAEREIKVEKSDFNIDNMLTTMRQYYRDGRYDFLLNSTENIDLLGKRFIVFEIDSIKENRELFPVVTIIIMEAFINKMRRLKGVRKQLIVEEAWKALSSANMAEYLRYMYKTVRKYYGEAIVVTQEVDDIISSPVVKESIINAYAAKSGLSHARIANLMSNETWMNAKKAVELGFADEILFAKKEEEPDSDPADPENPEEDPDSEPGEGEEKKPFQKDTAGHLFSSRQMDLIVLNRLGVKPEDVGQKHTEPKEPPADPKPSAEPTPPAEPPANPGPVLDMDGKTEDGSIPYNILMKQLECMK